MVCGARTRSGEPCKAIVVAGGKRCRQHGGYSTGPRTLMGKLLCGATLKRYRISDGGRGKAKTSKTRLRRERRQKLLRETEQRQTRQSERQALWKARQCLVRGLPLLTDSQLYPVADSET